MTQQIPVVFGIDVEPDGRPARRDDPVHVEGFLRSVQWLEALRPRLAEATGSPVRFTWFVRMDPQIAEQTGRPDGLARQVGAQLGELRARGDQVGLHTHAGRWDSTRERWVVDQGDPEWIDHCIRTSFAAFAETYGEPCRRHRFGDRWTSPEALDLVASLGARVDLSIEPGKRASDRVDVSAAVTGRVPSYLHFESVPMRHRGSDLWLLPLSAADPGPALALPARLARRIRHAGHPLHRPLVIFRKYRSPHSYWDVVERLVDGLAVPYLAVVMRSDLPIEPGMEYAAPIMEALLERPLVRRIQFSDPLEVVGAV